MDNIAIEFNKRIDNEIYKLECRLRRLGKRNKLFMYNTKGWRRRPYFYAYEII